MPASTSSSPPVRTAPAAVGSARTPRPASSPSSSSGPAQAATVSYTALARRVRGAGLQSRARGFYLVLLVGLGLGLSGVVAGVVLLDGSWWQLLLAAAAGVLLTQVAFVGHEASHRQVLTSGPANDRLGKVLAVLCAGISYSWWMDKHTRHHQNPNKPGKDPDVAPGVLAFVAEDATGRRGAAGWFTRHQGVFFFPLLLGEGLNLHVQSVQHLWRTRRTAGHRVELVMLLGRFAANVGVVFWLLPPDVGAAFVGVQLAVFGLYMGSAFAPNHIGMTVVPRQARLDFFSKQVLTSRNVSGGWWATALLGGLNYQVEHHLFPSLPRPHLAAARRLVREHCRDLDVPYTETSLPAAWGIVVRHLNDVGLGAGSTFRCPVSDTLR